MAAATATFSRFKAKSSPKPVTGQNLTLNRDVHFLAQ
jgi:hypothetical protein